MVWPEIEPDLAQVLHRGAGHTLDLQQLHDAIQDGRKILWVVHRGDAIVSSVVLEFVRHASGEMALRVVAIAGAQFWEWAHEVQRLLLELSEITGAERLEAVARPGLERWLEQLGWRRQAVVMARRVAKRTD